MKKTKAQKFPKSQVQSPNFKSSPRRNHRAYPKRIAGMKDKFSDLMVVECATKSVGGKT